MGKAKAKHRHLPPRMRLRHGAYYYADSRGGPKPWVRLAGDYATAIVRYGELEAALADRRDFAALADLYLKAGMVNADNEPLAETTARVYRSMMKPLKTVFGRVRPQDIEQQHAYKYMAARGKTVARQEIVLLSIVLTFGVRRGWIKYNPLVGIKLPRIKKRKVYIDDERLQALLGAAEPEVRHVIRFLHYTALRVSDGLRVRWKDWKPDGLHVQINKTKRTGKATLHFERTPGLEALMAEMRQRNISSFSVLAERNGKQWSYGKFYLAWSKLVGDEDLNIHDLRRKRLTDLANEKGVAFAQSIAAHTDPKTTAGYVVSEPSVAL